MKTKITFPLGFTAKTRAVRALRKIIMAGSLLLVAAPGLGDNYTFFNGSSCNYTLLYRYLVRYYGNWCVYPPSPLGGLSVYPCVVGDWRWYTANVGPGQTVTITLPGECLSVQYRAEGLFFVAPDGLHVYSVLRGGQYGNDIAIYNNCSSVTGVGQLGVGDGNDFPTPPGSPAPPGGDDGCPGMPVWRVSEPYITLWLEDEPLGYQPAIGPRISFRLSFKGREAAAGYDRNGFSVGKKWNFSWRSYVVKDWNSNNMVFFPGGGNRTYTTNMDYLTNTRLTGDTTNGFTLFFPDGGKDVYGLIVTNSSGTFQGAFLTERWNAQAQKTTLNYFDYNPNYCTDPNNLAVRLKNVVDGDGRTNSIYYATNNSYSSNLISQVADPFGRSVSLAYDNNGRLTNITDVAGISTSFACDTNDWVTNMTTPYGTNLFTITDSGTNVPPNGRSVLVTEPDGSKQLYLYTNNAPGVASSYATNQVPSTSPFTNTFDNSEMDLRNSFHWGRQQYAALSTTNISSFTASDYLKARMRHWLKADPTTLGETLSMERWPSPDGVTEGQKTWYDYASKTNSAYEGTQVLPLFTARMLPDGTTAFTRTARNGFGAVTNEVSTYSIGSTVYFRTNSFAYAANEIDLLSATNSLGVQVSCNAYNAYHQVFTNYNALNEMTVYTYDNSNRLTSISRPSGLVTTNIYGADGYLAQQIDVGIATNSFTYTNGLVFTHTDPRVLTVTNTWDALQRLRRVDYPGGTFITNCYDKLDLVRAVDRTGFPTAYHYDALRQLRDVTNALNRVTHYEYCTCGTLESITDPLNQTSVFVHDNAGRMTNTVYADNYSVNICYDLAGRLITVSDSAGSSVTNWYNNQGLLVAVSNALGRVQTAAYDILDRVTNSVDANGVSVDMTYDALGRLRSRAYPDGGMEKFGYTLNVSGPTSYTNQLEKVTRFGYDAAGRKIAETNANQEALQFTYSGAGDLLTLTDGKNQITRWNYDQFGRATNKLDATSAEIFRYAYDPNGRLTNRWTAVKGNTVYRYDPIGNLTNVDYAASPDITLQYDALNRLTNMVDAVGTNRYTYTAAGQLLSEDGPWASDTVSYTYNNRRRSTLSLLQPSASAWSVSYGWDAATRLTNVTSTAGSFGYSYLAPYSLLPATLSLPNGAYITNTYDSVARLLSTTLKNTQNSTLNTHDYSYNQGNQRTQQVFTPGNYVNYTYDNIGQLRTAKGKESGAVTNRLHEQMGYAYDAASNLKQRTNNALMQTVNVNSLNELSTVSRSGTLTVAGTTTSAATNVSVNSLTATRYADYTFAKDGFGLTDGTNTFTAIAQDNYGRVDTNTVSVFLPVTNSYSYDQNGNLTSDGRRGFDYDDENQLVRIVESNAWKSEFTYDGRMRRRIETNFVWQGGAWIPTNVVRYVYDGNLPIQHRDSNNVPVLTLTRGLDFSLTLQGSGGIGGLLAMTEASGSHSYYHADGNGNVTCLVNTNQLIVARYLFDPFGNTLSISGPKAFVNRYRFSSKPIHELSGNYDFLRRWYAPELQRWPNHDPLGELYDINLYRFVYNSPLNYLDVNGLWPSGGYGTRTVHQASIDRVLNNLPEADRRILRDQQRIADSGDNASIPNSFQHAMRPPGQSVEDARTLANQFARREIRSARCLERMGQHEDALRRLGNAMHLLQDATSPAHTGFQEWRGSFDGGAAHFGREDFDPRANSALDQATRRAYDFFNSNTPIPRDFNFFQ